MEIRISTRNLKVSTRFREYVAERAHKIEQLLHRADEFKIQVTRHDHSRVTGPEDEVELTVFGSGHVIRVQAHATDKFAAFDAALAKMLQRLRRIADKRKVHHGRHGSIGASELASHDFAELDLLPVQAEVLESIAKKDSRRRTRKR